MALLYGLRAQHQTAAANKPHLLEFLNARSAANDTLLEILNGTTAATRKFACDLNGKWYSAAFSAGSIPYAVTGGVANVRRFDELAIGSAGAILRSTGTAPAWTTWRRGAFSFRAASAWRPRGLRRPRSRR